MAKDIHGHDVIVGSKVKVLNINPSVWLNLPDDEKKDLKSMIGEIFEVYETTEQFANVEKWWKDDESNSHSHSIALHSKEIELIE